MVEGWSWVVVLKSVHIGWRDDAYAIGDLFFQLSAQVYFVLGLPCPL